MVEEDAETWTAAIDDEEDDDDDDENEGVVLKLELLAKERNDIERFASLDVVTVGMVGITQAAMVVVPMGGREEILLYLTWF